MTCHMGSYADENRELMEQEAVENLLVALGVVQPSML